MEALLFSPGAFVHSESVFLTSCRIWSQTSLRFHIAAASYSHWWLRKLYSCPLPLNFQPQNNKGNHVKLLKIHILIFLLTLLHQLVMGKTEGYSESASSTSLLSLKTKAFSLFAFSTLLYAANIFQKIQELLKVVIDMPCFIAHFQFYCNPCRHTWVSACFHQMPYE